MDNEILLNALAKICAGIGTLSDTKHNLTKENKVGWIYDKLEAPFNEIWDYAITLERPEKFYLRIKEFEQ